MAKTEPQSLAQIQPQNEHYWRLGLPTWLKAGVCLEGLGGSFFELKDGPFLDSVSGMHFLDKPFFSLVNFE